MKQRLSGASTWYPHSSREAAQPQAAPRAKPRSTFGTPNPCHHHHPCHDTVATAPTPKVSPRPKRGGHPPEPPRRRPSLGAQQVPEGLGGDLGGAARLPLSPPRGLRGMAAASSASRSGRRPLEAGCLSQAGRSPGRTGARHVGEAEPPPPS